MKENNFKIYWIGFILLIMLILLTALGISFLKNYFIEPEKNIDLNIRCDENETRGDVVICDDARKLGCGVAQNTTLPFFCEENYSCIVEESTIHTICK